MHPRNLLMLWCLINTFFICSAQDQKKDIRAIDFVVSASSVNMTRLSVLLYAIPGIDRWRKDQVTGKISAITNDPVIDSKYLISALHKESIFMKIISERFIGTVPKGPIEVINPELLNQVTGRRDEWEKGRLGGGARK